MKRMFFILYVLMLLASCSHDDMTQESSDNQIMLRAMTKAGGASHDMEQTPVFLFWFKDDMTIGTSTPYFVSYPQSVIDDYKTVPYNTGYPYPENITICANGYCPSSLVAEDGYAALTVPEASIGRLDITAATGFVEGSKNDLLENKIMTFDHLCSKVNFYARLGEIPAERYFREVKITVNGKNILTDRIEWDEVNKKYHAAGRVAKDVFWVESDPNRNQMDPNEIEARTIGSLYMHPGESQIRFDVELEMSETVTFDSHETISTSATVPFTGGPLLAGEEYDIVITILYDTFVIQGNKAKWQDGGKIPLPFYPGI